VYGSWSMAPVVTALQALRGMAMVVAVTLVAEVGDLTGPDDPVDRAEGGFRP
jgi:transposase